MSREAAAEHIFCEYRETRSDSVASRARRARTKDSGLSRAKIRAQDHLLRRREEPDGRRQARDDLLH
eukprot:995949-Heterocapsa_arctica.AAC.1